MDDNSDNLIILLHPSGQPASTLRQGTTIQNLHDIEFLILPEQPLPLRDKTLGIIKKLFRKARRKDQKDTSLQL